MGDYNPLISSYLDNGIQVISQTFPTAHLAGVGFIVGSLYDPPRRRGMTHLAEHMMAQRSTRHTGRDIDLMIWRLMGGYDGDVNIRVDRVSTFYGFNDLFLRDDMYTGYDAFAQMTLDGILDARGKLTPPQTVLDIESLDIEKAAVHNEYHLRGTDVPEYEIQDLLYQSMWERNPIRNRIDCEPDELAKVTLSEVKRFVRRWYKTSRMFVIFIGPDHKEAVRLAKLFYDDLPASQGAGPELHAEMHPVLEGVKHIEVVHPGARQHHVVMGFPTGLHDSPDDVAMDVLSQVLSFRVFEELRPGNRMFNRGVYRAPAYTDRSFAHGILYAHFATVGPYDYALRGADVIARRCDDLKRTRLSAAERGALQEEIDAAKHYLDKAYLNAFRRYPDWTVELIIDAVANGDREFNRLNDRRNRIAAVDVKAVRKAAERYLQTDRCVRVVLKPLIIPTNIYDRAVSAVPELEQYIRSFRPVS